MAVALCHPLYPTDDAQRQNAILEANGTSGFLRLAQEYQEAFGPSALNDKIRSLVPDSDYRPGDLHKRLLRLPWADVFSTNWDTLLERTCIDVFDRSYDVVRTVGEIPFAMRPRIVKLHGSFPAHEPFIFTEEEYRTYPARFSPFVNLAQQSMMETIFCLVGFSGDDPNFLHWSGWVRDNLGAGAPKIYLVGWLELSIHRRRMLEARKVMPVDLSALPGANRWPPDLRHRYATEWFIAALERGKRYGPTLWPSPPPTPPPSATPGHLGPIPTSGEHLPLEEPFPPTHDKPPTEHEEALRSIIAVWSHNRRLYPGWLIAPEHIRQRLWQSLSVWIPEFSRLQSLSAFERLQGLSELAWWMARALLPFPSGQEEAAYEALATIDRVARTVGGAPIPENSDWSDTIRGADALALALVRNGRHAGDRMRFDRALQFLTPQRNHDATLRNAIAYEECLWDLATGDLAGLLSRLDAWTPDHSETLWCLRKAGLLAEMQEHPRACALLETTLVQIRRSRRRDLDDLVSLSLEGWALFLALAYSERGFPLGGPVLSNDSPEPFERWRALGIVDCNAFIEYRALRQLLETNRPTAQRTITKRRGFDLDQVAVTHHMGGPSSAVVGAYQMMMLAEVTGIPPAANRSMLFEDGLRNAAEILTAIEPWLASQLAIRIETSDKLVDDVFSRVQIARLREPIITLLHDTLLKRLAFGRSLVEAGGVRARESIHTVGAALEILSRVAVRLRPEQLHTLFTEAAAYYRSPLFRRWSLLLGSSLGHLLARILESLSRAEIADLLPQLFGLPLPQEAGLLADARRWQDPVTELPDWFDGTLEQDRSRPPEWEGIISHLLIAAKTNNASNRGAAIYRLHRLLAWQFLTENEKRAFAMSLWALADGFGLPKDTNLPASALLTMPEERPGRARDALMHYIEARSRERGGDIYERLATIGELLWHFSKLQLVTELPQNVREDLVVLIDAWAEHRIPRRHEFERMMNRRNQLELAALEGVAAILPFVNVTEDLVKKIRDKTEAMDRDPDDNVRAFSIYPFLVQKIPDLKLELLDRLRRSLGSDQEDEVRLACRGLYLWIIKRQDTQPDDELDDLVREVGIGIAARRAAILRPGLGFAQWIFHEGPEHLRQLIVRDCEHGLMALLEEASYARTEQNFDVPAIRAACVLLASAMAESGFTDQRGVTRWLAIAKDDPLPEVRNAETRKGQRNAI